MSNAESKNAIAARLREARRLAGLSQGKVAEMMKWHRPTVSQIEAGDRNVSADEIADLARIYDVSSSWIIDGANENDLHQARAQLAARELEKLKPEDLSRLLQVLAALRRDGED